MPSADDDHALARQGGEKRPCGETVDSGHPTSETHALRAGIVQLSCAICGQPIEITNGSAIHVGTHAFPGVWVHTGDCYRQIYVRWKSEWILNQADAYA